jgi:aspartate aminotransferase
VISEYRERRDTLTELNKIEGVVVSKPKVRFIVLHNFNIENADDFAQWLWKPMI